MICHEIERAAVEYLTAVAGLVLVDGENVPLSDGEGTSVLAGPPPTTLVDNDAIDLSAGGADSFLLGTTGNSEIRDPFTGDRTALTIYKGENNTEIRLPCVICSCQSADEDFGSGNHNAVLEVQVVYPADANSSNSFPLLKGIEASHGIIEALLQDDLPGQLNRFRGERLTVQGMTSRSCTKGVISGGSPRAHVHTIMIGLYASACDLEPVLPP